MNSTLCHADTLTHLKIVALALLASTAIAWIGISARISSEPTAISAPAVAGPSMVSAAFAPAFEANQSPITGMLL